MSSLALKIFVFSNLVFTGSQLNDEIEVVMLTCFILCTAKVFF